MSKPRLLTIILLKSFLFPVNGFSQTPSANLTTFTTLPALLPRLPVGGIHPCHNSLTVVSFPPTFLPLILILTILPWDSLKAFLRTSGRNCSSPHGKDFSDLSLPFPALDREPSIFFSPQRTTSSYRASSSRLRGPHPRTSASPVTYLGDGAFLSLRNGRRSGLTE